MKKRQIVFAGNAGQGFIAAGSILANAVTGYDGMNAAQRNYYGPEKRDGMASTEIIISDGEIIYPNVEKPDVMLLLANVALPRYGRAIPKDCILIYDDEVIDMSGVELPERSYCCRFAARARELGGYRSLNIMCLGAAVAAGDFADPESVLKTVDSTFPAAKELNRSVFLAGMELINSQKE